MSQFPELEEAMGEWVHDAVHVLAAGPEPDTSHDLRRWQRDSDGVFRDRQRLVRIWPHQELDRLRQLPSWRAVEQILLNDPRLRPQMDTLVGTIYGGSRLDAERAGQLVLPLPDEVGDLEGAFRRRYEQLDKILAAPEIELFVVWPIPGLTSSEFPIALEPDFELDVMSDGELAAALNTEVLPLTFPGL